MQVCGGSNGVFPPDGGERHHCLGGGAFQGKVRLRFGLQALECRGHGRGCPWVFQINQQARSQRAHIGALGQASEHPHQQGGGTPVTAVGQSDERGHPDIVQILLVGVKKQVVAFRHAQIAERGHLGSTHPRPGLLLRRIDDLRRHGPIVALTQRQRRGLSRAWIGVEKSRAQGCRSFRVGDAGQLARGEEAEHAVRGARAEGHQLRCRGRAAKHAESLQGSALLFETGRIMERNVQDIDRKGDLLRLARGCRCKHEQHVRPLSLRRNRDLRNGLECGLGQRRLGGRGNLAQTGAQG